MKNKWKILIVKNLLKKEMRFCELKKNLGCTAKVLTACLKEMEEDVGINGKKFIKFAKCIVSGKYSPHDLKFICNICKKAFIPV